MASDALISHLDTERLQQALVLAERAIGLSDPNPRVGCVIGRADGTVLGQGHTQQTGGPHAEVMALRDAAGAGANIAGATAWLTLEPCAHFGHTPPCADALVTAGIVRAVVAIADPFPQVNGRGIERLRAAGIEVVMADATIAAQAHALNIGFFSRVERGRPWVRIKAAMSLDGMTALHNGASQWITGPDARRDGHAWRRRASAVLTGIGTVIADDPGLEVRLVETARQPIHVVLDSQLRLPPNCKLVRSSVPLVVFAAADPQGRAESLRALHVDVRFAPGRDRRVDLYSILTELARLQVNELHVEAGHTLNAALLQAGLVDELVVYAAPRLLGPGRPVAALEPLSALSDTIDLQFEDVRRVGEDLRIVARPRPRPL